MATQHHTEPDIMSGAIFDEPVTEDDIDPEAPLDAVVDDEDEDFTAEDEYDAHPAD
ncbi:MAG: hypothetical protein ABWX82_08385 [Leifsonia sp.]